MHLLAAIPGGPADEGEAVDLGQSPADVVFLSAADSEISAIAGAYADLTGRGERMPSLRAANILQLRHNLSVDIYVDTVIAEAKLVILRLLGGVSYWPYGVEQIVETCRRQNIALAVLPGDDKPDLELDGLSTIPTERCHRLWQYCVQGGPRNMRDLLAYAADCLEQPGPTWGEPRPMLRAGLYWPGIDNPDLAALQAAWVHGAPVAAIVFYRALMQAGTLAPVDALIEALGRYGLNALPLYVQSLKDPVVAETVAELLAESAASVVLNCTGFAVSQPGARRSPTPFDAVAGPVLQVVLAGSNEQTWRSGSTGLPSRDVAMNVSLPEVDGRILSRAVAFKSESHFDATVQASIVRHEVVPDRVDFVAALAAAWQRLAAKPVAERRVALVLANYPNRDGRIGNGVGLDVPASTVAVLHAMCEAGYAVHDLPTDATALMERVLSGPTNAVSDRLGGVRLSLTDYDAAFAALPAAVQAQVRERWGPPEDDPFVRDGAFVLAVHDFGHAVIGVQPARGYNIDPVQSYHDPALVPPHGYFAFYIWLRRHFGADAIVHMGKHGNLEWLPGKALALSEDCFPEAVLGPLPHLYPFIVNDPGEGTQAKRRAAAVIVDHLTPPMTRAGSYGPLAELEQLVDEFYEAAGSDPRRLDVLRRQILELTRSIGLDKDCGIAAMDDDDTALSRLDNYLCELKEMQIRDGLHVFGASPTGRLRIDLLAALTRLPRGEGKAGNQSLIRALALDLGLAGFDPLDCEMAEPWQGLRPQVLAGDSVWRTAGDTVERLESLAADLIRGECVADDAWHEARRVLDALDTEIAPAVDASGMAEIAGLLNGLDGRFVEPGPSGAPTRGRPEVLPTGRNFYSVDNRTVPTPAAWHLGWKSAEALIDRHRQEHGAWPRSLAISAWGTSNMRTGGDDLAQAMALMGVRPTWDTASRRVTGFEIMPLSLLQRPRVDVTLRISGFFRDAFPGQIELLDSAVRSVAALDEPALQNPLAARVRADAARLEAAGSSRTEALRHAGYRVFGSRPGAYGAGLQALIDERGWHDDADLARAYTVWGGYAYGKGEEGRAAHDLFEGRLKDIEVVVHNQDNREHDLLDSDDYYQFEGGITAAVRHLSGRQPAVYHNDHANPERPRVRTLEEEIARVVRARVVNPKWIAGVMRHGYKGAFEIAATVDYLFAFAATARVVADHHFDAVYDAYLGDAAVRAFLAGNNAPALTEIAERLLEAQDRGLWRARSNSARRDLMALAGKGETD